MQKVIGNYGRKKGVWTKSCKLAETWQGTSVQILLGNPPSLEVRMLPSSRGQHLSHGGLNTCFKGRYESRSCTCQFSHSSSLKQSMCWVAMFFDAAYPESCHSSIWNFPEKFHNLETELADYPTTQYNSCQSWK